MSELINRIAKSGLITLDPGNFLVAINDIASFDLTPFLFKGLILREKDFRDSLKEFEWSVYKGKATAIFCSSDAIVPRWSYMLVATYLQDHASFIGFGTPENVRHQFALHLIDGINIEEYIDKRVVIKGCGDEQLSEGLYVQLTRKLIPVVKSLMYGEPCSTVPIFKNSPR